MDKTSPEIAILGAGITGLVCAYVLLEKGCRVHVYDPSGFPADNASWKAGGMLAPYSEIEHMDMRWVEAGLNSIGLWARIQEALQADFDFHVSGSLLIAHADDRYILERFRAHLPKDAGEEADISSLEPALASRFSGGVYLPGEAHLHPKMVMRALCEYLRERVEFYPEAGDPEALEADFVLDCRGMGAADSQPELRGVKGELAVVYNPEFSLSRPVRLMHPRYPLYIVPRPDHVFMIGATVIESDQDEQVSLKSSMELMSALYSLHPSFGQAKVLELCAGIRPGYPDNLPRISRQGHILRCNGLFRHGFLLAPVLAACLRDMIAGGENCFEDLFTGLKKESGHGEDRDQRAA